MNDCFRTSVVKTGNKKKQAEALVQSVNLYRDYLVANLMSTVM